MRMPGLPDFPYYVGVGSLAHVATREDRVCVLNILGGESSEVTPVGHAYSGGNVVFGTAPGKRGQVLETPAGPIPVYNNVLEGLNEGHRFNCGVVYLPPSAARDGVAELIRVNPELRKIFIVTEKMAVHDSREIRALGQQNGIDIFGGNSLGVADAWNRVRIGGALGGDHPEEALRRGSIAIFSNSGNFTTTIATYLRMAGWGTTTLISSGKDVYIHFAAAEFAYALDHDPRSKAAVLYAEPGGFYERDVDFGKPVVACVVGRWKKKLTRAVGHAGAMSGGDDDAIAKERWFLDKFGVDDIFTPERPVFSARGAVVTNIAHIPAALTAVMDQNGVAPDFKPEGSLALKPWFASNVGCRLPAELDLPVVTAMAPYDEQIARINRQIGATLPRQNMKDASGASQMDAQTQVTALHGTSMLDAAQHPLEANIGLALLHEPGGENDRKLVSLAVGAEINLHGTAPLIAAQAARTAGNAPNSIAAAALAIVGPNRVERARRAAKLLIDIGTAAGVLDALDETVDIPVSAVDADERQLLLTTAPDVRAEALLAGFEARGARSVFVRWLRKLGNPDANAVLAAITTTLAWGPLRRKRISRYTAESLPWWMCLFGTQIGASVEAEKHVSDAFCGIAMTDLLGKRSLTEIACIALLGQEPSAADLFAFQTLVGLLLSNGPGSITGQGAKGAVSADGPDTPARVQLNKAMLGFLSHSGYAHGGNGYEGVAFLIERFADIGLTDPGNAAHGIDLAAHATAFACRYGEDRATRKNVGAEQAQALPCINHPVFKGKPVNVDPREAFVHELFRQRGEYNVFHEYYRALVQALYEENVTRNVFCVNVDAVIAALLLKMLWRRYRNGSLSSAALEAAAFTVFLYGRMIGSAAEIDDHANRGKNMDTRTPQSACRFVA